MKFHLYVAISFTTAVYATLVPEEEIGDHLTAKKNIVAFYNVYAGGKHFDRIVQEQVQTIKGSGLFDKLDSVYYATNGEHGRDYSIGESNKYVHIAHKHDGTEFETLNLLHRFCGSNPTSKVLYFHDKGSFHQRNENEEFRKMLNCYVLNTHCIDALDSHDLCGWRISPVPNPHYSGNFWWARCDYINTLIDPMAPINNQTFIEKAKELNDCVAIKDRYFAEFWVTTGPTYRPADCMNASIDTSYLCGYAVPKVAYQYCHGPAIPSGLVCDTASTYKDAKLFRDRVSRFRVDQPRCRDNSEEINKRTQMLYGQAAHTYNEWMDKMFEKHLKPTENALFRFHDSQEVFVVRNGVLRGVPNLKTFLTLGKDFDEVKVLLSSERSNFTFGEPLPSV